MEVVITMMSMMTIIIMVVVMILIIVLWLLLMILISFLACLGLGGERGDGFGEEGLYIVYF